MKSRSSTSIHRKRSVSPSTQMSTAATLASSASPRGVEGSEEGGKAGADRSTTNADDEEDDDDDDDDDENYDNDDDDENNDDDEGNEDENNEEISDARLEMETKFVSIMTSMALSKLERTALRLAVSSDDEIVKEALSAFSVNKDESSLITSLRRVIDKVVIEIKSSQAGFVPDDDSEGEDGNISPRSREKAFFQEESAKQSNVIEDDDEDEDDEVDDEEEEYENDEFETAGGEDQDEEEEDEEDGNEINQSNIVDPSPLGTKSFRKHIVPILLHELELESIFTSAECQSLLKLFHAGDSKMTVALDRYDVDHDMAYLVDSFQIIASRK